MIASHGHVRVIADSIAENEKRITTLVVPIWRPLLAELNTHRALSRNSASSRAIPIEKMLARVSDENAFMPQHWGRNQKGMQAGAPLSDAQIAEAMSVNDSLRRGAIAGVERYIEIGLHKQIANRYIEPWLVTEVVVTATEWENMLALRTEVNEDGTPMAEPHFYDVAQNIVEALNASEPRSLEIDQWHLPFLTDAEWRSIQWGHRSMVRDAIRQSVARCGRASYFKHDQTPATSEEDFLRHDDFVKNGHMSPTEHQATPAHAPFFQSGNLMGWIQYRKMLPNEDRTFSHLKPKQWRSPR